MIKAEVIIIKVCECWLNMTVFFPFIIMRSSKQTGPSKQMLFQSWYRDQYGEYVCLLFCQELDEKAQQCSTC